MGVNLIIFIFFVLIVSIISGILSALYALSGVLGLKKEDETIIRIPEELSEEQKNRIQKMIDDYMNEK